MNKIYEQYLSQPPTREDRSQTALAYWMGRDRVPVKFLAPATLVAAWRAGQTHSIIGEPGTVKINRGLLYSWPLPVVEIPKEPKR